MNAFLFIEKLSHLIGLQLFVMSHPIFNAVLRVHVVFWGGLDCFSSSSSLSRPSSGRVGPSLPSSSPRLV